MAKVGLWCLELWSVYSVAVYCSYCFRNVVSIVPVRGEVGNPPTQ